MERDKGKWIKHEEKQYIERYVQWSCSECGYICKRGWSGRSRNIDQPPRANFCARCGADMRGDNHDSL